MPFDKLIVTILGIAGIVATYWFFFGKKEEAVYPERKRGMEAKDSFTILVDGGYKPSKIVLKQGQTTKLNFIRKDSNSCLEEVVIPEFKIRRFLPLNEKVTINITPDRKGEFSFSCRMNMFHGKIIIT